MTISGLIGRLQALRDIHGDLPVYVYDDWNDFEYGGITHEPAVIEVMRTYISMNRPERIVIHSQVNPAHGV